MLLFQEVQNTIFSMACYTLLFFLIVNYFSSLVVSSQQQSAYKASKYSNVLSESVLNMKILELAKSIEKMPTSKESFDNNMQTFRSWLVSQKGKGNNICKYTDLIMVRLRYVKVEDRKFLDQLDTWILEAGESIVELSQIRNK